MTRPVFALLTLLVVLVGCGSIPAGAPTSSSTPSPTGALADCSGVTFDRAIEALRDAPSYSYLAEGRDEVWEPFTGAVKPMETPSTAVLLERMNRGSYIAPDRFTEEIELTYRDDIIEARRLIGDRAWLRFVGSMRWRSTEAGDLQANQLLELVQAQPENWTGPNNEIAPGYCAFETSGTDGAAERSMTMIVDPNSGMPVDIDHAAFSLDDPDWSAVANIKMTYRVTAEPDVAIDEPSIDRSPVKPEEALYAFERSYCGSTCAPTILSQSRDGNIDVFCIQNAGERRQLTFVDGLRRESVSGCDGAPMDPPRPGLPTVPPLPPPTPS
jgi:hypothetical protein